MSKTFAQTIEDLQNKATSSNEKLSETLQQLLYEVQPQTQLDYLLAQAKYQAEVAAYNALTTLDEARDGDEDARMKVAKAAAIGAAVVGICILRHSMKRRRRH